MIKHYDVWADGKNWGIRPGGEWWQNNGVFFYTVAIGVASAQAKVSNMLREPCGHTTCWKSYEVGEDGLPILDRPGYNCIVCGKPATTWMSYPAKVYYYCDAHESQGRQELEADSIANMADSIANTYRLEGEQDG